MTGPPREGVRRALCRRGRSVAGALTLPDRHVLLAAAHHTAAQPTKDSL